MITDGTDRRTPPAALAPHHRLAKTIGLLAVCLVALSWIGNAAAATTAVDPSLLAAAKANPAQSARMIILSTNAVNGATSAFNTASAVKDGYGAGTLRKQLSLVGGVAVTLPAARVSTLAKISGLTVSPDATRPALAVPERDRASVDLSVEPGSAHADHRRGRLGCQHERSGHGESPARPAGEPVQPVAQLLRRW